MNANIQTVNFHGDQLLLADDDGKRLVPVRPLAENLGMSWSTQHAKLVRDGRFNCVHMNTVGADGRDRQMLCLPVEQLSGWLFSINPNKIKDEHKRAKVKLYQAECVTVLHDYWTKGIAVRDDMDGVVTDLSPAVRNVIGGMVKTCVRAVMQEIITEHLPKLIDAKLQHDPQRVAVRHIPALQVALDKGVNKRPRGLVQRISNALSRHCEGKGIVVLRDVRGTKLFDRNVVHEWLSNGGWAAIKERLDEVGGQSHLKLIR